MKVCRDCGTKFFCISDTNKIICTKCGNQSTAKTIDSETLNEDIFKERRNL